MGRALRICRGSFLSNGYPRPAYLLYVYSLVDRKFRQSVVVAERLPSENARVSEIEQTVSGRCEYLHSYLKFHSSAQIFAIPRQL